MVAVAVFVAGLAPFGAGLIGDVAFLGGIFGQQIYISNAQLLCNI